jgi:chemotaxis methyl-accepting protein methylase
MSSRPGSSLLDFYLRVNHALWNRLPAVIRSRRPVRLYGAYLHGLVCRRAKRQQYFGTFFLRNRPALEQIRRLLGGWQHGSTVRIAVLGCSIGAEVYSVLWTVRSARPDLQVRLSAADLSAEILEVAANATYTPASSGLVGSSIFERLSETERQEMFDWEAETATVKPWIRAGISWHVGDAGDPALADVLGPQDIVLASNFLCHMEPPAAERCLRNIARLLEAGGYLFVTGVDLEVRTRVAAELGWQPVRDLIREIHDGDPSVRRDWPWAWWGLEPLDDRRSDWQLRYAVAYRVSLLRGD